MEKIISAKTIDDAVAQACAELNLEKSEFTYEIVEMEKKGFLGLGSKPAVIKVTFGGTPERYISAYLKDFFALLGVNDYEEEITVGEDRQVNVQLNGQALEEYTSKGCNIVESLQYILVMSLNKQAEEKYRLTLNINDYKERSAEKLQALAIKTAKKVLATKRKQSFMPMSSFQRRIIHSTLSDFDENITTFSVGEEPNRKVVVSYTGSDRPASSRRSGSPRGRKPYSSNREGQDSSRSFSHENEIKGGREFTGRDSSRPPRGRNDRRPPRSAMPKTTTSGEPFKMTQIYPKPAAERDNSAFKVEE